MTDDGGIGAQAGWYPDPEFPGQLRFWDGSAWTDERKSAAPPPPPMTPRASSNAGAALALSIIGFLCCGLTAPIGMIMGRNEMKAIDAGLADPTSRGTAQAAWIVGLVATILFGLAIAFYAVILLAAATGS